MAAVLLVLAAAWLASREVAGAGSQVLVVRSDLPLGSALTAADLDLELRVAVPDGALSVLDAAVGKRLASAIRRGEVVTDARLVDRRGADPGPGRIAVTVRPAESAVAQLLQPGAVVDVLAVDSAGAVSVATREAMVLTLLTDGLAPDEPPPVVLSVSSADAERVSAATLVGQIALQVI